MREVLYSKDAVFLPQRPFSSALDLPVPSFFQLLIPLPQLGANNGYWVGAVTAVCLFCGGEEEGGSNNAAFYMHQPSVRSLRALFPINQSDPAASPSSLARIYFMGFSRLSRTYPPSPTPTTAVQFRKDS